MIYFDDLLLFFMCINVLHACMYVCHECVWYPCKLEENVRCPGTGVMNSCEIT